MNLKGRVERLEATTANAMEPIDIFLVSVSPEGPREMGRIQCGDQVWHRLDGETEQAFTKRATTQAPQPSPNCARMFVCDPAGDAE